MLANLALSSLLFLAGHWTGDGIIKDVGHYRDEFVFTPDLGDKLILCSYKMIDDSGKVVWEDFFWTLSA